MKVDLDIRGTEDVRRAIRDLGASAAPSLVTAINRTARDFRSRVLSKTTKVYNISRRELGPFVRERKASRASITASVSLAIRAIPIETFKPRVRMQKFTFRLRGRTVTRTLPAIYLKRLRAEAAQYVGPAFPLTQRRSGALAAGEKVRRRIGSERERLTRLRYYTFPREFIDEQLLPDAAAFIPERVALEIRRAVRRKTARGDTLRQPR